MRRRHGALLASAALLLPQSAAAQDHDLRDLITTKSGKELRGRVATPFARDTIALQQGGKRMRVERSDIASMDTVADRLAEFLRRRQQFVDKDAAHAPLYEWAKSRGLDRMADLHAMERCIADDHGFGHEALGHQKRGGEWLWPHAGTQRTLAQLEKALADEPLTLTGERFAVRIDGNLRGGIHALFDLERMGVCFMAECGESIGLSEALQPVLVDIRSSTARFQKWGFKPSPWYEPPPHGDVGRTFYSSPMQARPQRLFFTGAHGLLYRTLIGQTNSPDDRDRVCTWLEIGLPMHFEMTMQGDAGRAEPGDGRAQNLWAAQAMTFDVDLARMLNEPMFGGYYLTDDSRTQANWAVASMFAHWLMQADNVPASRERFLAYVRVALGDRRGNSTTAWDSAMKQRITEFGAPFREWLQKTMTR